MISNANSGAVAPDPYGAHADRVIGSAKHRDVDFAAVRVAAKADPEPIIRHLLPNGKQQGVEWVALNPNRNDKTLDSFKVNTRTGLWGDFATAKDKGDLIALWAYVRRISNEEAMYQLHDFLGLGARSSRSTSSLHGKIVATYDYTEADGTLLYQVVRYEPKDFRQRRPDGRGWTWKLGEQRVIYRLPDLAKYPDATVFVCEGEKDADRVASLGHCATTVAAGKWTSDCVKPLAGRDIFILEDNDQAGREKAQAAAMALHQVAASIRVVSLPGLPAKGDVSDWLDTDPSHANTLVDVCLGAPVWQPSAISQAVNDNAPDSPPPIRATPYVWKDPTTLPPREWLYGHLLLRKMVSATISPGGTGKSSLITAEALAMVSGESLLDVRPAGQLKVWLWNLEDPLDEIERKIQASALHYGLEPDDIGDRLLVNSGRDQKLVIARTERNGTVILQPVVDAIVAEIIRHGVDVIVIDPFVSCHEAAENDNGAMDMVIKEWSRVADRCNCAVHLVHHTRKMGEVTEVTTDSSRGGSAQTDACRVVRAVSRMTKQEATNANVYNHRLYFRTYNDKANLQPPADSSDWFKLESVNLGNGPMGPAIGGDSVGVVTRWEWPDLTAGMTAADYDKVAKVVRSGTWKENVQATNWVGHAVAQALGLDVKADKAKIKAALKMYLQAGTLVVVERKDEERRESKRFVEVPGK